MGYEMIRKTAAAFGVGLLAAIIAFCPTVMCAAPDLSAATHPCCPHSHHPQNPLPCDASSQTCPYSLLEKAKSIALPVAVPPLQIVAIAAPAEWLETVAFVAPTVLQSQDLYLRNRVLLI
jgi:hypothetical protein